MRPGARCWYALPLLVLAACDDDAPPAAADAAAATTAPSGVPATPSGPGAPTAGRGQGDAGREPQPPRREIHEGMFLENQGRRDPFRTFWSEFTSTIIERADDRDVRLANFALDDLRLVAVVVGTDNPYAMVIDPTRAGTILRRGMYVGRQEVIHSNRADTPDYPVHWRIARITGGRLRRLPDGTFEDIPAMVVLERPDPLNPGAPVVERPLTLIPRALTPGTQNPMTGMGTTGAATTSTAFLPPSPAGGPPLLGGVPQPGPMPPGVTTQVFNYTTPGQPTPAPPPTTVVVQPQAPAAPAPQGPSNTPPPIQVTGPGSGSLPSHGLGGP